MSEVEDIIMVDRMEDVEAIPFGQPANLLDFATDAPVTKREESPISSTTDQFSDFLKPEVLEGFESPDLVEVPDSMVEEPAEQETVQTEPETVSSSVVEDDVPPYSAEHDDQQHEEKPLSVSEPETETVKEEKKELTSCMAKWLMENNIDQRVIDLIYWKCWKKTGVVFAGVMFILTSMYCCTLLSVVTLFSMSLLAVAFLYRIGMTVFNAVQKTSPDHPFKSLLEENLELSEETVQNWTNKARNCTNSKVKKLQKLFLIEDAVESVKFGVMLWLLSYIGAWFSLLTIAILACVYIFTFPVLYERNQEQADKILTAARSKTTEIFSLIQAKLPEKLKFGKTKED